MIILHNTIAGFENSIEGFEFSDLFVKSEQNTQPSYISYAIDGEAIYNCYKTEIQTHPFNFSGQWTIEGIFRNDLTNIPEIGSANSLSSAITKEWCNRNLISQLQELSAKLYESGSGQQIPSYVGEVIVSNTLNSESKVKGVYGGEKWVQIKGRFLLASGSNERNTITRYGNCSSGEISISKSKKMGGTNRVSLTKKNVPGHSHTLKGQNWGNLPGVTVSLKVDASINGVFGKLNSNLENPSQGTSYYHEPHSVSHTFHKHRQRSSGNYGLVSSIVSINDITGKGTISKSFTFVPKGTVTYAGADPVQPHDNMPKHIVKYIWERTK